MWIGRFSDGAAGSTGMRVTASLRQKSLSHHRQARMWRACRDPRELGELGPVAGVRLGHLVGRLPGCHPTVFGTRTLGRWIVLEPGLPNPYAAPMLRTFWMGPTWTGGGRYNAPKPPQV